MHPLLKPRGPRYARDLSFVHRLHAWLLYVGFFEVSWFGVTLAINQAVDSVVACLLVALPVVVAIRIGWRALWRAW